MTTGAMNEMGTGSAPPKQKDWRLTQEALDTLLARLDSDRDEAGRKYEMLRRKLIKFLSYRGSSFPEDQTDEAISRTARKLVDGQEIENLNAYVHEVARFVWQEAVREAIQRRNTLTHMPRITIADRAVDERRRKCYQRCLDALPAEERDLIVKYYAGPSAPDRQELSRQLGRSLSSLRVMAFRIRKKLENSLNDCLSKQDGIQ